jgi:Flp pilus assembly pilin Flp
MMLVFVRLRSWVGAVLGRCSLGALRIVASGQAMLTREEGQTTAEYALVILAAAAVAVVLIGWAKSSGKLPAFFDKIIDDITANA